MQFYLHLLQTIKMCRIKIEVNSATTVKSKRFDVRSTPRGSLRYQIPKYLMYLSV